jgi:hypothetical protein
MSFLLNSIGIKELMWGRPASMLVVMLAIAGILLLVAMLYRRQAGVPKRIRLGLVVARLLVLGLLVAALFEPIAVRERTQQIKRRLSVLIDVSASMSIKDQRKRPADVIEAGVALGLLPLSATTDVNRAVIELDTKQREAIAAASRVDLAGSLIQKTAKPIFQSLGKSLDIDYYVFGSTLRLLGNEEMRPIPSLQGLVAEESGTSISESLEAVSKTGRGIPLAGIVLLSDGLETSSRRAETVLNNLGIQGVPVYSIPLGLADPDDVSIRNIVMQEVAFTGDKVPVRVQIRSKGYEKRTVNLVVKLNGRSVASRRIKLAGGLQFEDIFFNVDLSEKGAAKVEVSLEPFADEATAENNVVARSVRVVNEKINVLCIEGSARWEFRYLRAMLKRDPRINATFIATRSGPEIARNSTEYIARFPERRVQV